MSRSWSVSERGVPRKSRRPDEDCQGKPSTRDLLTQYEETRAVELAEDMAYLMSFSTEGEW